MKIEHIEEYGVEAAIRGMRNPMNSWDLSDTENGEIGPKDMELAKSLVKAGVEHRKFLRFLTVTMDITAPLYWWKQWDTYKVGTVSNSCSTMHRLVEKRFKSDDFSLSYSSWNMVDRVAELNELREQYLKTKNIEYWYGINELLPQSYKQKRTVQLSYETILKMIHERGNHKLQEWNDLIETFKTLKYSELLEVENNDN